MLELIPHTKRRSMTKARAARIFLAHNGKCCNCGQQIRQGEQWFVEHPVPLAQGGADDDTNTAPAHTKCKPKKDATDAASKAKRDRIVTAGWADRAKPKWQSQGFAARPKQRSATRPIIRKSERTEA
jgi:hypothetical protein